MVRKGGRSLVVYDGRSYQYALTAYWQAVNTAQFLSESVEIVMKITRSRQAIGGFETHMEAGKVNVIHEPSGRCIEWAARGFTGGPIEEKLLTVIPGTLGLPRRPGSPPTQV